MKCEILQSPMNLYRSLLFIAIAMNDYVSQLFKCNNTFVTVFAKTSLVRTIN